MENNRVYKFLWRANAVFLFIAGIGLIALLITFAALLFAEFGGSETPPPAVSAQATKNSGKEVFELRHPSQYERTFGSDFTYFELRTGADSYGSLSSSSSQLRNIGVYDLNTDRVRWVFPDAQQEIEEFKSVGKTRMVGSLEETLVRTGFILTVAKSLVDGSLTRDVWVMPPDGTDLRKLLSDVSQSPALQTYGGDQKKLIMETKTHIDVYPFDIDMLTVGKPTRVSIP